MQILKALPGSSTTVNLFLATSIIAVLIGVAFSFPAGVEAHECLTGFSPADRHEDSDGIACQKTDGHGAENHPRIKLDPSEGPRGATFSLKGWDYPEGTVTFFDQNPAAMDDAEIIGSEETRDGVLDATLRAGGAPGSGDYTVYMKDSEGVVTQAVFHIVGAISFEPPTAITGEDLTINIADWGEQGVALVRIGGVDVHAARIVGDCLAGVHLRDESGMVSLEITVPSSVLSGVQTVSAYHRGQLTDTSASLCDTTPDEGIPGAPVELNPDAKAAVKATIQVLAEPVEVVRGALAQNIIEVDGGREPELELRVYPSDNNESITLEGGDLIEIRLPGFDLSGAGLVDRELVRIYRSSQQAQDGVIPAQVNASDGKLTLTLPASPSVFHVPEEYLGITIGKGTGILAPEIPLGFDGPGEGYPVTITFIGAVSNEPYFTAPDVNTVVVKNPISSSVPNITVRIELVTYAEAVIGPNQEITADFSGSSADSDFIVPASISASRVSIRPVGGPSFNPSDILIQGARVILTIPSGTAAKSVPVGEYRISFSQLARIKNPFAAGNRVIGVSSSAPGDRADEITAVIKRTTTIDNLGGPRGTTFTLEGKGYSRGTVTIYHDANNDNRIDAGETLASVITERGAFTVQLEARGEPGDLVYRVRTRDSEGVGDEVVFLIRSGMLFDPPAARVGWPLRITISDWQEPNQVMAAVSIAGETAHLPAVREYENCFEYTGVFRANRDGAITLEIEVPRNVPEGEQTVSLYGYGQLEHYRITADGESAAPGKEPCEDIRRGRGALVSSNVEARLKSEPAAILKATLDIDTADLTLSPSTVARRQRVTITGSGFTRSARGSNHIDSVWIGGQKVADDPSVLTVGSNGDIAFAVTVPLDIPDGPNEVRIEGSDHTLGQASLTVPEASITLDPPQGQRGTNFTITGSGFIANAIVVVTYGAGVGAPQEEAQTDILLADSQGGFELSFQVPGTAQVGKRHLITAVAEEDIGGDTVTIAAEASHLVPRANITTTPDAPSPGDRLNIRGENLPAFAQVGPITIEGSQVLGRTVVSTDKNGSFETDVLVPNLEFGDYNLTLQVADVIVPVIITVAPPPLSGPPSQVFKYLIRSGALLMVWHYDNATQSWSVFDPSIAGDMSGLNDLTEIGSGDIVWVSLSTPQRFQDRELTSGWNLIALR